MLGIKMFFLTKPPLHKQFLSRSDPLSRNFHVSQHLILFSYFFLFGFTFHILPLFIAEYSYMLY